MQGICQLKNTEGGGVKRDHVSMNRETIDRTISRNLQTGRTNASTKILEKPNQVQERQIFNVFGYRVPSYPIQVGVGRNVVEFVLSYSICWPNLKGSPTDIGLVAEIEQSIERFREILQIVHSFGRPKRLKSNYRWRSRIKTANDKSNQFSLLSKTGLVQLLWRSHVRFFDAGDRVVCIEPNYRSSREEFQN